MVAPEPDEPAPDEPVTEAAADGGLGYDSLTGLVNGPTLARDLTLALRQGTRYQHPVGMLVVSLDGVQPDDTYGPRDISEVILHSTRDTDVVGRLGADEFGVVLTRVIGAEEARVVARRIIVGVVGNAAAGPGLDVGCSVGVALAYPGGTDAETLLLHAGTALTRSKGRRRNGCELYVEEELNAPWM